MKGTPRKPKTKPRAPSAASSLRVTPESGTQVVPTKNQGYQLPLPLWQELVDEAARRRKLGMPLASQNAIAIVAITAWLEQYKGVSSR